MSDDHMTSTITTVAGVQPGERRVRVVLCKDKPEFTAQTMRRREIEFLRMLMHRHKDQAKRFALELVLDK